MCSNENPGISPSLHCHYNPSSFNPSSQEQAIAVPSMPEILQRAQEAWRITSVVILVYGLCVWIMVFCFFSLGVPLTHLSCWLPPHLLLMGMISRPVKQSTPAVQLQIVSSLPVVTRAFQTPTSHISIFD